MEPEQGGCGLGKITQDGVIEKLRSQYGDKAESIVKAFAKNFPDKTPMELWAMICLPVNEWLRRLTQN